MDNLDIFVFIIFKGDIVNNKINDIFNLEVEISYKEYDLKKLKKEVEQLEKIISNLKNRLKKIKQGDDIA